VEDDESLLARWCGGDQAAGGALFERHFESVRRFFKSKVGPQDAEDLIQRTFLGCVKNRAGYRGESSFRGYLFGVARNELHMHFRTLRRHPGLVPDASVQSVVDLRTGVSTQMGRADERRLVQVALRHLPVEAQTLLELAYWEAMTANELADVFGVSPITIRTRKHRAREKLRDIVEALRGSDAPRIDDLETATVAARDG